MYTHVLPLVAASACMLFCHVLMGACSVQGYGEKAPGIGAFVYPGSGATCDTRPASAGATAMATTSVAQPYDLPTAEEVGRGYAPAWMIFVLQK